MVFLASLSELENKSTFGSDVKNTQQRLPSSKQW